MLEDREWGKVGSDVCEQIDHNAPDLETKRDYLGFGGFVTCLLVAFIAGFIACGITRIF